MEVLAAMAQTYYQVPTLAAIPLGARRVIGDFYAPFRRGEFAVKDLGKVVRVASEEAGLEGMNIFQWADNLQKTRNKLLALKQIQRLKPIEISRRQKPA